MFGLQHITFFNSTHKKQKPLILNLAPVKHCTASILHFPFALPIRVTHTCAGCVSNGLLCWASSRCSAEQSTVFMPQGGTSGWEHDQEHTHLFLTISLQFITQSFTVTFWEISRIFSVNNLNCDVSPWGIADTAVSHQCLPSTPCMCTCFPKHLTCE